MKLSIVVPVYNEKNLIATLLDKVKQVDFGAIEKEIIVVDDCSTDGTSAMLEKVSGIIYLRHEENSGKGAAVKTGFSKATGDIVVIQDGDLEYDPRELKNLIQPIVDGFAEVVYGSRFIGNQPHRVFYIIHYLGNRFLTSLSNILTGLTLTDMETCYKAFSKKVIFDIKDKISARRFGIEPELTALVARGRYRIYEIGISYYGRTYQDGKKINYRDGLAAIWHIIKFNLWR